MSNSRKIIHWLNIYGTIFICSDVNVLNYMLKIIKFTQPICLYSRSFENPVFNDKISHFYRDFAKK